MRTAGAGDGEFASRVAGGVAVARLPLAVTLLLLAGSGDAGAQQPGKGGEAPIGTFTLGPSAPGPSREFAPSDGFSVVEPPDGVPERRRDATDDGSGRWFFQGWDSPRSREPSPDDLYKDARTAMDEGRRDDAQRLFERLIAKAPNSPHVPAARQYLGQIYRSVEAAAPSPVAPAAGAAEDALPWRSAASTEGEPGPAALDISQPVPRMVLHQARVSVAIDSEFLSEAGDRVFFSAGSADLGARARGVIQAQARFLARYPELYAAVEGHADDGAPSDAESVRISEARAAVVRDRLVAEGVDAGRLVAYGRGVEDRVSDCLAPECLAQNRRTITILLNRRVGARPARSAQGGAPASRDRSPTQ